MHCGKCGMKLPDESGFCPNCARGDSGIPAPMGAGQAGTGGKAGGASPAFQSKYIIIAIVGVVALLLLGVVAIGGIATWFLAKPAVVRAQVASDAANERAAKAAMLVGQLSGQIKVGEEMIYDAETGQMLTLDEARRSIKTGYGKCTGENNSPGHKGGILKLTVDNNGNVKMMWGYVGSSGGYGKDMTDEQCSNVPR